MKKPGAFIEDKITLGCCPLCEPLVTLVGVPGKEFKHNWFWCCLHLSLSFLYSFTFCMSVGFLYVS